MTDRRDKKDSSTALDIVRNVSRASAKLGEAADGYLALMESEPRPEVKVGEFYVTFDGSIVYAARRRGKCTCPVCSGSAIRGPMGLMIQIPEEIQELLKSNQDYGEHDESEASPEFIVVIIKGGHGVKNTIGEHAGDRYTVDAQGWTVMGKIDDDNRNVVAGSELAICGLSLRRQIRMKLPACSD